MVSDQKITLCLGVSLTHFFSVVYSRIVKIFELAFPLKVTLLPSLALWLVFRPTITHTQRPYGRQRLRGPVMDWKHLLAYITGTVDQALLLRNEYLVTKNRILRNQLKGHGHLSDGERPAAKRMRALFRAFIDPLGERVIDVLIVCDCFVDYVILRSPFGETAITFD
jgi:hypothetical protein